MELANQIRQRRTNLQLSQEELADKIYVSRQTVSNWETGKSCPDIHSLLLLASVFGISLDQLVKGDIQTMKTEISEFERKKWNRLGALYTILLVASILSFAPLVIFGKIYGIAAWTLLYAVTMITALKLERIKKENHIHTYKEIVAFTEGRRLDELTLREEKAKRPYQTFLCILISGCLTFAVTVTLFWILN